MNSTQAALPIVVLYATREGQTRRIAEHIGATVRARGRVADVIDVAKLPEPFPLGAYGAAIVAASVHVGEHERAMVDFVKRHREQLDAMPSAFLSVSLSEAGVEDQMAPAGARAKAQADVQDMLDGFFRRTGWHPGRVKPVAGALLYTKYGMLVRFVMKFIAWRAGGSTDTSRDHEYTDWEALDRFVSDLLDTTGASV